MTETMTFLAAGDSLLSDGTSWLVLLALLGLLILIAAWSSLTRRQPDRLVPTLGARHLFLALRFQVPSPTDGSAESGTAKELTGHLIELSSRAATLVSPRRLARGQKLRLVLETLPGFPAVQAGLGVALEHASIDVEVRACRSLGGETPNYLVSVRLLPLTGRVRQALLVYIGHLTGAKLDRPQPGFSRA